MFGQTRNERRILRNPALMKRVPFLVGGLVVAGFLADDPDSALIFWVGAAIAVVLACRPSLTIAREGLIVCNMLPRRYLWNEIVDVDSAWRFYGPALCLRLHDGSKKYAWAVMSGQRGWGLDWIDQTIRRVRQRWELETAAPAR